MSDSMWTIELLPHAKLFLILTHLYIILLLTKIAGRKNFSDKISEATTPESSKGTGQKIKESFTDKYDKGAKQVETDEDKGIFQKISDTISGNKK